MVQQPEEQAGQDLHFAVRFTALALLIEFALSWRTFVPGWHLMGTAPLIPAFAALPDGVSIAFLIVAVVSVFCLFFMPERRAPALRFLACELFFCLRDVHQLQPWMIMYSFTLLAMAGAGKHKQAGLNAVRIMVCCVYFWAGFHKLNYTFYASVFPWFIAPLHAFKAVPELFDLMLVPFILVTPFFESLIGILLLFPRRRRLATFMAFIMLLVVLACLGPLGHAWGMPVWPWNVYLFGLELRLFYVPVNGTGQSLLCRTPPEHAIERLSFVLFALLPVLAIFTPWYSLPGFKLYSGNIVMAEIILAPDETLARVPATLGRKLPVERTLDMLAWFASEQKNGVYPTAYALRAAAAGLCPYLDDPAHDILRIYDAPPFYSLHKTHTDTEFCHT